MAAEGPKVPDCAVLRQTSRLTNAILGRPGAVPQGVGRKL